MRSAPPQARQRRASRTSGEEICDPAFGVAAERAIDLVHFNGFLPDQGETLLDGATVGVGDPALHPHGNGDLLQFLRLLDDALEILDEAHYANNPAAYRCCCS